MSNAAKRALAAYFAAVLVWGYAFLDQGILDTVLWFAWIALLGGADRPRGAPHTALNPEGRLPPALGAPVESASVTAARS